MAERSGPLTTSAPRAAYIHVPFCRHRCGYCNFTVVAGRDDLIANYLKALDLELARWLDDGDVPRPVDTLFLGGGTPTHLSVPQLGRLFEILAKWFHRDADCEFSIEANPSDLDSDKLQMLAHAGVGRLSLGAQSFNANKLERLERDHHAATIENVVQLAKQYLKSVSIDLIFGAPEETRDDWSSDLRSALALQPDHISTYGLTFERGTLFWNRLQNGLLKTLAEDDERWMYETAIDTITQAGYQHYEVSNFAKPNHRCRHNETYWTGGSYYAAGPGAARYVDGRRETNHRSTTTYLKRVLNGESPVAEQEDVSAEQAARERLVFGLRRLEGVDLRQIAEVTEVDIEALVRPTLERYLNLKLIVQAGSSIRLTRNGLLVSDALWPDLL